MRWLWYSLLASIVLTVVLNLAVRLWPGVVERGTRRVDDLAQRRATDADPQRRAQVIVPWKAMLLASILLTVLLNVVVRL